MDFSPVIISLKTAVCALLIVFPAGTLLAWQVMNIQRQRLKIVMDSLLTLPLVLPPYSGRPFIALSLWREPSAGAIFSRCIRRENCLFLCLHGDCLGLCLLPHDVPLCPRRF